MSDQVNLEPKIFLDWFLFNFFKEKNKKIRAIKLTRMLKTNK